MLYNNFDTYCGTITSAILTGDVGENGARINRLVETINNPLPLSRFLPTGCIRAYYTGILTKT